MSHGPRINGRPYFSNRSPPVLVESKSWKINWTTKTTVVPVGRVTRVVVVVVVSTELIILIMIMMMRMMMRNSRWEEDI